MFSEACVILFTGGVHGWEASMAGGHPWLGDMCIWLGACMCGGVHGWGAHVWLRDMHGWVGHVWLGVCIAGGHAWAPCTVVKWAVRILLEC